MFVSPRPCDCPQSCASLPRLSTGAFTRCAPIPSGTGVAGAVARSTQAAVRSPHDFTSRPPPSRRPPTGTYDLSRDRRQAGDIGDHPPPPRASSWRPGDAPALGPATRPQASTTRGLAAGISRMPPTGCRVGGGNCRHGPARQGLAQRSDAGLAWAGFPRLRRPLWDGPYSWAVESMASAAQLLIMPPMESRQVNVRLE